MGEAITDEAELALLDILLDGVEGLLLGDLSFATQTCQLWPLSSHLQPSPTLSTYLHLSIGPSWHLNNHVEDGLLLIGIQRDVVERRARLAILLDVDAVLEGVGGVDLAGCVDGSRLAGVALLGDGEGCHVCWIEGGVMLARICSHWSAVVQSWECCRSPDEGFP